MKHLYSHWTLVKLQRPLGVLRGTTPIVLSHGIDGIEVEVRPEDALLKHSEAVGVMQVSFKQHLCKAKRDLG